MLNNKVSLTIIHNPIDPIKNREMQFFDYKPLTVAEYIKKADVPRFADEKLHIAYKGKRLTDEEAKKIIVSPGDNIGVFPLVAGGGGGNNDDKAMQTALSIFVMYASMGVGNAIAGVGGFSSSGMASWGMGSYLAAMAVQAVGGYLISTMAPKQDKSDTNTYGFNISTDMRPGGAIQETFGRMRVGGTCIGYHVRSNGEKQYGNLLLSGGNRVDIIDLSSLKINNNSISNYNEVELDYRLGENDDTPIKMYNDTYNTVSYGDELTLGDAYTYHTTEGYADGLELNFSAPKGLYYSDDDGFSEVAVKIKVQYRKQGTTEWKEKTTQEYRQYSIMDFKNGAEYITVTGATLQELYVGRQIIINHSSHPDKQTPATITKSVVFGIYVQIYIDIPMPNDVYSVGFYDTESTIFTGKTPKPYVKTLVIDNIEDPGIIEVRCQCYAKGLTGQVGYTSESKINPKKYQTQIYWASLGQIVYDDFAYPGTSKVCVKALASDKLNGDISNITWIQERTNVWVFNPITNQYEQKPVNNPAWACYEIYHQAQRLKNINTGQYEMIVFGEDYSKIDYQSFKNWADFCTGKGLICNYYADKIVNRYEATEPFELVGRGHVFQKGTLVSCWFDGVVDAPVQQFTPANIGEEGFSWSYLSHSKDRANAIEVKFRDEDRDFDWRPITVYGDDWDNETTVQNPIQITLDACTKYDIAFRHAKQELRKNKYILREGTLPADIDAILCGVGDVISVQQDLPRWGMAGGRIEEVTTDTITIDKEVTLEAGKTYAIQYRLANDLLVEQGIDVDLDYRLVVLFGMAAQEQGDTSTGKTFKLLEPFTPDTVSADKVDGTHFEVVGDWTTIFIEGVTVVLESNYNKTDVVTVVSSLYDSITNKTTVQIVGVVPDSLYQSRYQFTMPRPDDLYSFGEVGKVSKLWRILSSDRDSDQYRKFSVLEYIPEVYDDSADVPPEVDWDNSLSQMVAITANEWIDKMSGIVNLYISWKPTKNYNGALIFIDGERMPKASMSETSCALQVKSYKDYLITVQTLDFFGNVEGEGSLNYTVYVDPPPASPTEIITQQFAGGYVCIV